MALRALCAVICVCQSSYELKRSQRHLLAVFENNRSEGPITYVWSKVDVFFCYSVQTKDTRMSRWSKEQLSKPKAGLKQRRRRPSRPLPYTAILQKSPIYSPSSSSLRIFPPTLNDFVEQREFFKSFCCSKCYGY